MNERRMIVVLLTVIAVVLTLNLVVNGSRTAEAQYGASGPVDPTVVAATAHQTVGSNGSGLREHRLWRMWSDGRADMTLVQFTNSNSCSIVGVCGPIEILPGSCSSDTDRNGNVEFPDLLNVLSDWGPCE